MNTLTFRKAILIGLAAVLAVAIMLPAEASFAGVKKYTSKGNALQPYHPKNYKPVSNKKLKPLKVKNYHYYSSGVVDMPHLLGTKKGNKKIELQTLFHLPKTWSAGNRYLDLGNPQSISVTPDGNTAYVTHSDGKKGYIVRYNFKKLRELGMNIPGNMGGLRAPWRYDEDTTADMEKEIRSCVKVGPKFKMGHGAAFAYNPKDKCLWFCVKTKYRKTDLWRVNMKTLKPDLCINYTFDKKISFGNNMTFDKNGKLYQFQYASSNQWSCPKDAVKIYQGTINLKAKKKVKFKLMMNVIKYPVAADHGLQSAGYDYKNHRIYIVSNSAIMSVPVKKLQKNKVTGKDVWMTQFNVNREFEGFQVDKNGNYYLLVNKYPEVMTQQDLERYQLRKSDFDKYGEYIYPEEDEEDQGYDDDPDYYEDPENYDDTEYDQDPEY